MQRDFFNVLVKIIFDNINLKVRLKLIKCLFVIDYQNDYVQGDVKIKGAKELDLVLAQKIKSFDGLVFYTLDTHLERFEFTDNNQPKNMSHCIYQTHGWQVYGKTNEALQNRSAVALEKNCFGLDLTKVNNLLPQSANYIELVGIDTCSCVLANAIILASKYPNAIITVNTNLCATNTEHLLDTSYKVLQHLSIYIEN